MTAPVPDPGNLGDILERVLDRGVVIAGDIRVSLLDIELLTIKLRLVVASVDTAKQMGIDWWEHDPWLTARPGQRPEGSDRPAGPSADRPAGLSADQPDELSAGRSDPRHVRAPSRSRSDQRQSRVTPDD